MEPYAHRVLWFIRNAKDARHQQSALNALLDSLSVQTLVKPVRLSQDAQRVPHQLHVLLAWQGTTQTPDLALHVQLAVPAVLQELPVEDALLDLILFLVFVSVQQVSI